VSATKPRMSAAMTTFSHAGISASWRAARLSAREGSQRLFLTNLLRRLMPEYFRASEPRTRGQKVAGAPVAS
jgi:hypothetical protein